MLNFKVKWRDGHLDAISVKRFAPGIVFLPIIKKVISNPSLNYFKKRKENGKKLQKRFFGRFFGNRQWKGQSILDWEGILNFWNSYSLTSKYPLIFFAAFNPTTSATSVTFAARTFFTEPKCRNNLSAVFSPTPGISTNSVFVKNCWGRWFLEKSSF